MAREYCLGDFLPLNDDAPLHHDLTYDLISDLILDFISDLNSPLTRVIVKRKHLYQKVLMLKHGKATVHCLFVI